MDGNDSAKVNAFRRDHGAGYPIVACTNDLLMNLSPNESRVPQLLVFHNGKFVESILGWAPPQEAHLKEVLANFGRESNASRVVRRRIR